MSTPNPATTPWVPLWPLGGTSIGELAYGQAVAPVTCPAATEATATPVITAPAITVDGVTPIVIEAFIPSFAFSDSPNSSVYLFDGSTSLGFFWAWPGAQVITGGLSNGSIYIRVRLTPAAGTHTYSLRASVSSGAGIQMLMGPGGASQFAPGYIRITLATPISNAPAGALLPVQYGTSLPTSPVDGQECILVDSLTVPSYQWHMRYNAQGTTSNKWECIGGMSKTIQQWANINMAVNNTWTPIPTMAALTAPYPGLYEVCWGANLQIGSLTAHITYIGLADGGYSNVIAGPAVAANTCAYPVGQIYPEWGFGAGGSVQIGMKSAQAQTWTIVNPWTSIKAKRIRLS